MPAAKLSMAWDWRRRRVIRYRTLTQWAHRHAGTSRRYVRYRDFLNDCTLPLGKLNAVMNQSMGCDNPDPTQQIEVFLRARA